MTWSMRSALAVTLTSCLRLACATSELDISPALNATAVRDLFPNNEDYVFDFGGQVDQNAITANGGQAVAANLASFPALVNNPGAQTLLILDACSMNPPHVHPRGTELLFLIEGEIQSFLVEENPSERVIMNTLKPYQNTFFPQGLIHTQVNLGCEQAKAVASFNTNDPGTVTLLAQLFRIEESAVLQQAFQQGANTIAALMDSIPGTIAPALEECKKKCGYGGDKGYTPSSPGYSPAAPY